MRRDTTRARRSSSPIFVLAAVSTAVLAACGGGGDAAPGPVGAHVPEQPAALSISGVAARGAALAGAAIEAKCAGGTDTASATATAKDDGSYTLKIADGVLPCALKATASDETSYYSIAAGSGASTIANITPLTQLVVAQLTGQEPSAFFTGSDGAAIGGAVTVEKIDAASSAVVATLKAAGVDTAAIQNIVSDPLAAGTGQGYDGVLDTLGTTLASAGSSLGELVTTVATTAAAASASAPATTSGGDSVAGSLLPAELLLRPKADGCAPLRNGDFRLIVVKPSAGASPTTAVGTMDVNAAGGPTWTFSDGLVTLTPVPNEACHYTVGGTDGIAGDVVVSPSGVAVGRLINTRTDGEAAPDSTPRMVIAMPVQSLGVADLTGDWNTLGWVAESVTTSSVDPVLISVAADGKLTLKCDGSTPATPLSACTTTDGPYTGFSANAAGGFDLTINDADGVWTERAFAYRAGNGQTAIAMLGMDGTLHFLTRQRTLTAPMVGDQSASWNVQLSAGRVADALSANRFEITAADATGFTRTATALATRVSHSQTLGLNDARDGWVHRASGTATGSDSSTVTIREMYSLKLGVGISAYWMPANNPAGTNARFGLSVAQP